MKEQEKIPDDIEVIIRSRFEYPPVLIENGKSGIPCPNGYEDFEGLKIYPDVQAISKGIAICPWLSANPNMSTTELVNNHCKMCRFAHDHKMFKEAEINIRFIMQLNRDPSLHLGRLKDEYAWLRNYFRDPLRAWGEY